MSESRENLQGALTFEQMDALCAWWYDWKSEQSFREAAPSVIIDQPTAARLELHNQAGTGNSLFFSVELGERVWIISKPSTIRRS